MLALGMSAFVIALAATIVRGTGSLEEIRPQVGGVAVIAWLTCAAVLALLFARGLRVQAEQAEAVNKTLDDHGVMGSAEVLHVRETGGTTDTAERILVLSLELRPPDREPFRGERWISIRDIYAAEIAVGRTVPVRFDAADGELFRIERPWGRDAYSEKRARLAALARPKG